MKSKFVSSLKWLSVILLMAAIFALSTQSASAQILPIDSCTITGQTSSIASCATSDTAVSFFVLNKDSRRNKPDTLCNGYTTVGAQNRTDKIWIGTYQDNGILGTDNSNLTIEPRQAKTGYKYTEVKSSLIIDSDSCILIVGDETDQSYWKLGYDVSNNAVLIDGNKTAMNITCSPDGIDSCRLTISKIGLLIADKTSQAQLVPTVPLDVFGLSRFRTFAYFSDSTKGPKLPSPDGNCWRIVVANDGTVSSLSTPCN